jgi:hypothetical protein
VQTENLIDILQAPPTLQYAETNNVEKISITTSAPPAGTKSSPYFYFQIKSNSIRMKKTGN